MPTSAHTADAFSHAGGVTYRERDGYVEILLVRARPAPHEWVLPKGHIEERETPRECARREIREEAGVDAVPVAFLGDDRFTTPQGESVSVAFFLMRFVKDVPADEHREKGWFTFAGSLSVVPFERVREIIQTAEAYLAERSEQEGH
jgi:ADP-ribose pyrophosphatase YjhB (NUDIX family)